jgi:hypothetical protein
VLVVLVVAGLNFADTFDGTPVAVSATALLKPLVPLMLMVVLTLEPPGRALRLLDEDEIVKPGAGMVRVTVVVLLAVP